MTDNSKTLLYKTITDLTEISVSSLDKLFEIAYKRQFSKGDIVLKQGQICNTIMFVEKGYLRTFFDKEGIEINTDFTFEGNFTTNLKSLRSDSSADNSIQAGEITTIYEFDKNKLLELYDVSVLQRINLSQLSSYLGIARETLSRIRKK
ncbi:MAG: Crp/Fnr family transcriptional regulator [Bacteroidetes bacterium]|nr:Crp/Fnr family transcriptional regulator [Bacteroidota bacterium]